MMRTSNPALSLSRFERERTYGLNDAMTVEGTVNKCFLLFFLLLISAGWVWSKVTPSAVGSYTPLAGRYAAQAAAPYMMAGGLIGFVVAIVTAFKMEWARITAPIYAVCEGLFLGGISALMNASYPGIVMQAVALTFGVLFCMLALYRSGVIKVTPRFMVGVMSATGAIFLVYMVNWIMGFFHTGIPFLTGGGIASIIFSLIVVGVAALNLVLDFYIIEQGAEQGAHKYMEWYGAFALMVTMVWLYIEILRLLAIMRRND